MAFYRPSADSAANQGGVAEFDTQHGVTDMFDALNDYDDTKYLEWTTGSSQRAACNTDVNIPAALAVLPLYINVRLARTSAGTQDPGAALYVFIASDDGKYSQSEFSSATGIALTAIPADGVFRDYSFHPEEALHSPGSVSEEGLTIQYGPAVGQTKGFLISHLSLGTATEAAAKTITASSDAHSAWDHEGDNTVTVGDSLVLNASVDSGYLIADVLVDGVSVGDAAGQATYQKTFSNVTADHTISVTSAAIIVATSVVTATQAAGSGGTVTASVANAVQGQTVRYTIRPGHGQRTSRFEVGGVNQRTVADPIVGGGVVYGVAMDAGTPIEYDYVLPPSPALLAVFDRIVGSNTSYSYDSQIASGMGREDLAKRAEKLRPRDYNEYI